MDAIFAGPKDHSGQEAAFKELWPMVFEKAWAKLHLSYEDTACVFVDDATNRCYLTGGTTSVIDIQTETMDKNWDDLFKSTNPISGQDADMTFCSTNTRIDADPAILQSIGLISGHAYSILSDKSPLWTPELKAEIGYEDEEDGTFWMTWQDYVMWFDRCRPAIPLPFRRSQRATQRR
jgi:hypothetical protein